MRGPTRHHAPPCPRTGTLLLALVLLLLAGAHALASPVLAAGAAQELEERVQACNRTLMCPVCPAETIDQSQVELAREMRAIVRQRLEAGETCAQVQAFFVERYGESVLAAPPREGFNLVAWVVPPAVVAGGALGLLLVLRAMRHGPSAPPTPAPAGGLDPDLAAVDRELALEDTPQGTPHPEGEGRGDAGTGG